MNHFGSLRSPSFSVVTLSDPGVARKNLNGIAPLSWTLGPKCDKEGLFCDIIDERG